MPSNTLFLLELYVESFRKLIEQIETIDYYCLWIFPTCIKHLQTHLQNKAQNKVNKNSVPLASEQREQQ